MTGKALLQRWQNVSGIVPKAFVLAKIEESRLLDIFPVTTVRGDDFIDATEYPPIEERLFPVSEIERVEDDELGGSPKHACALGIDKAREKNEATRIDRTRKDPLASEIENAIEDCGIHAPRARAVMNVLKSYAGKPGSCIVSVETDAVLWKETSGGTSKLTIKNLTERLRRRRSRLSNEEKPR